MMGTPTFKPSVNLIGLRHLLQTSMDVKIPRGRCCFPMNNLAWSRAELAYKITYVGGSSR